MNIYFRENLRRLRRERDLTQEALAEKLKAGDVVLLEAGDAIPADCLRIRISAEGENIRRITAEPAGGFRTISLE